MELRVPTGDKDERDASAVRSDGRRTASGNTTIIEGSGRLVGQQPTGAINRSSEDVVTSHRTFIRRQLESRGFCIETDSMVQDNRAAGTL